MRKEAKDYIDAAAKAAAEAVLEGQRATYSTNYYRAMESLLSNYKTLKTLVEDEEGYVANIRIPPNRSKDVVVAQPGAAARDRAEVLDDLYKARRESYRETRARFDAVDRVVRKFRDRPGFVVVRMYYFGEDSRGQAREPGTPRYTWEEIAQEIGKSERTARTWRTEIVQDMAVCMFGSAAAVSNQTRREPRATEAK